LTLDGLTSGLSVSLNIRNLLASFQVHEQITRLVCVEGWSAIAWWAGLRFDDLLSAYPPASQAKWARIESSVNRGRWGNPDPYFVSLDLPTARHPQTLLSAVQRRAFLHAVADRFLVNIQSNVIHSLHGGASLAVSLNQRGR
jgi:DMSO/TMAO reductase YedYZ molybdopterin-dependent catalytic subunit